MAKIILKLFLNAVAINMGSWLLGLILAGLFRNTGFYRSLSNLNFIKNETVNKLMGIGVCRWIVLNTPFKYLNQKCKLKPKISPAQLSELRNEMTFAEISHWMAFVCVAVYAAVILVLGNVPSALMLMTVNVFLNAYPSLLQQQNKRRIDGFLKRIGYVSR